MMPASIAKTLTVVATISFIGYLFGTQWLQTEFPNCWGPLRVALLLLDAASVVVLTVMLIGWYDDLCDAAGYRIMVAICAINWLFVAAFMIGLILFL